MLSVDALARAARPPKKPASSISACCSYTRPMVCSIVSPNDAAASFLASSRCDSCKGNNGQQDKGKFNNKASKQAWVLLAVRAER